MIKIMRKIEIITFKKVYLISIFLDDFKKKPSPKIKNYQIVTRKDSFKDN